MVKKTKAVRKSAVKAVKKSFFAGHLYLFIFLASAFLFLIAAFYLLAVSNFLLFKNKKIDVPTIDEQVVNIPTGILDITEPRSEMTTTSVPSFTIMGTAVGSTTGIRVSFNNSESAISHYDVLADFVPGQAQWRYYVSTESGTFAPGMNEYYFTLYNGDFVLDTRKVFVYYSNPPEVSEESLMVEWFDELKKASGTNWVFVDDGGNEFGASGDLYEAGVIKSGKYIGSKVFLFSEFTMGVSIYHVVEVDGQYRTAYSLGLKIDEVGKLSKKIKFKPGDYVLRKSEYVSGVKGANAKNREVAYIDPSVGELYYEGNCLVADLPDNTFVDYSFDFPFLKDLAIIFVDGKMNEDGYNYIRPTCGGVCSEYVFTKVDFSLLKEAGRIDKEVFYEFKDRNAKALKDLYNNKSTLAYYSDCGVLDKSKYTYEEFLATHPILFWKDPLGRWVELTNGKFGTMAEMCKPVIYLYPQEKIKASVKVAPNGGMTFSEPQYKGLWDVVAEPSGKLTVDGQPYDYLFWEGIGKDLSWPSEGFVVEKDELEKFFSDSLKKLSLNDDEIYDFNEYWIGRLSTSDYWQISFIDEEDFDAVAPLSVSPKPDTVIRVMIYAKPLSSPVSIKEQRLDGKKREGFTVVEWGGAVFDK